MKRSHISQIDLNLLKVFSAMYAERHTGRAGHRLFMSQSAVSHALSRLRELFGDPLFVRTSEGMRPTSLADRLAEPIDAALRSVDEALRIDDTFDPGRARLDATIAISGMHPLLFLTDLYQQLERHAPGLNLYIRALSHTGLLQALDDGRADLLLGLGLTDRGFASERYEHEDLYDDPLVCVVSSDNPEVGDRLDLETFAALPHLIIATDVVPSTWIDDLLAVSGLKRRIAVIAPHAQALPLLTAGTRLVATVARSLVIPYAPPGSVRILEPPFPTKPYVFQQIWDARTSSNPGLRWLRGMIRDSVKRVCTP